MFWLVLVVQESLEGSPGHVSLTRGLQLGPHFLGVTFHVVDCVHDPLLVFMISDWLEGEEVFATPDECLEHFLVLASVLLRVVERVARFFGNCVGDVGVLQCGFRQHGVVAVRTIPPNQVRLIGSTGLDSGLVLVERSVKEWVGVSRDSGGGLLGTVLHTRQGLY